MTAKVDNISSGEARGKAVLNCMGILGMITLFAVILMVAIFYIIVFVIDELLASIRNHRSVLGG